MAIYQNSNQKRHLKTGEPGVSSSDADTLNAGGRKLQDCVNQLYNTFADTRLYATQNGHDTQFLHATGFHQIVDSTTTNFTCRAGGMYDINTSGLAGTNFIQANLPVIKSYNGAADYDPTAAYSGATIKFQDSANSWGAAYFVIQTSTGQTITDGVGADTQKVFMRVPNTIVELTAYFNNVEQKGTWRVKTSTNDTIETKPGVVSTLLETSSEVSIPLLDFSVFNSVKYLIYAEEYTGSTTSNILRTSTCELLVVSPPNDILPANPAVNVDIPHNQYATVVWSRTGAQGDYEDMYTYDLKSTYNNVTRRSTLNLFATRQPLSPVNNVKISVKCIELIQQPQITPS